MMAKLVYFDTSVWMAPYDRLTEPRKVQIPAIEQLINKHNANEIVLCTSRQVMNELRDLLKKPGKAEKASNALRSLELLHLTQLPFTVAVHGKAFYDEARYGQEPKFNETSLSEKDKLIAEFMTANSLDYFVSVDEDFLKRRTEIEALLAREHTSVLQPQELLSTLSGQVVEDTPVALASADQVQKARIALLEHHTSQMQGYKYYILTLVLGIFAVLDFWSRAQDLAISVFGVNLDSVTVAFIFLGFISGSIFYSVARMVCYGQTVGATTEAPILQWNPQMKQRTLMKWLDECIYLRTRSKPRLAPIEVLYQLGLPKRHLPLLGVCAIVWSEVVFLRYCWWSPLACLVLLMIGVFVLVWGFPVETKDSVAAL
jgi:predicted nucleic acid-binding protein